MLPLRRFALVLTAGLLTGCAVGPDYHRPDAPLAERYITESAVLKRSASQSASFSVWWDGFKDPLLSKFVTDALAQNLDLAQATARMTQSGAGLGAATAAPLQEKELAPVYQVRQSEGALAQVKATVPVLRTGLDAAMNALDVILGTPPGIHRKTLALQALQITSNRFNRYDF